jgi:leucyl aminopeptidase
MPFTSSVLAATPAAHATPLLAIAVPQGAMPPSLAGLDGQTNGALSRLYASNDFHGKRDETALLHPGGPAPRILLIGLGTAEERGGGAAGGGRTQLRRVAAIAARRTRSLGLPEGAFFLAPEGRGGLAADEVGQVVAEGLAFGAWQYLELKQPPTPEEATPELERFTILAPEDTAAVTAGHRVGQAVAAGQSLTRRLQVLPGNLCTPSFLAEQAAELARQHGFSLTVLDLQGIRQENLGALLAVAQGSAEEPRFIVMEYRGAGSAPPVVLIGKGITFDTGGISIKPADKMEDMKYDMSGAAAVFGVFEMVGRLRPAINLVGIFPTCENMPSGVAVKPGDVIRTHLGKTIEVVNTDAEGRLILADALSYARRFQPACVLDAATLTGAVIVALGHVASGLMGTDQALIAEVQRAADRAGEKVWPLPLWDEYRDQIKSDVADLKNTGGRPAGAITAGWFLREFAGGYPWAHLDIAGTAYSERDDPGRTKGPLGTGMRIFAEFILGRARSA